MVFTRRAKLGALEGAWNTGNIFILDIRVVAETKTEVATAVLIDTKPKWCKATLDYEPLEAGREIDCVSARLLFGVYKGIMKSYL